MDILIERANEANSSREDIVQQDTVVLFRAITDLVEATCRTVPRIWELRLRLVLDGAPALATEHFR